MKYARDVMRALYRYKMTVRSVQRAPEFKEYFTHYPLKSSGHSSHYYFPKYIGRNQDVLDLGCGEGFFAEQIADKDNRVVGVDIIENPQNADFLKAYIHADLSCGLADVLEHLQEQKFDRVLLQDIIEHLPKPERLLQDCQQVLKSNGQLLISVPNVANFTIRLSLLLGRFNYTERGILDKTHVRFFTLSTARRLLEENGYEIVHQQATIIPFEIALGVPPDNGIAKALNTLLAFFTALMPGLLGYQWIFVARLSPDSSRNWSS